MSILTGYADAAAGRPYRASYEAMPAVHQLQYELGRAVAVWAGDAKPTDPTATIMRHRDGYKRDMARITREAFGL